MARPEAAGREAQQVADLLLTLPLLLPLPRPRCLGIHAKFSNHPLVACEDPAGWRRGANMNLRAMAAADANTAERQRNCGVVPVGSQVEIRRKHDSAYYCGVETCGNVWLCPVCSAKIRARAFA